MPGDLFAVGRSLYVCTPMGFCPPITHTHEPKILEVALERKEPVVLITLDNGETRELFRSDPRLVSFKAEDLVGLTERDAYHLGQGKEMAWDRGA